MHVGVDDALYKLTDYSFVNINNASGFAFLFVLSDAEFRCRICSIKNLYM
jgi:hypothetical protein